jgi:hypothetical protein
MIATAPSLLTSERKQQVQTHFLIARSVQTGREQLTATSTVSSTGAKTSRDPEEQLMSTPALTPSCPP